MRVNITDEEIIGKKFKSNSSNGFTVIALSDKKDNRMKLFEIEFDEINGVRFRSLARKGAILKGKPKNIFFPSVYGVGYLGNATKTGEETVYDRWRNMLSRCYNPRSHRYSTYGAKGVTVCSEWLCFENYLNDFTNIDGYDKDNMHNLQIDKDTKIKGNKIYSLETCIFISKLNNSKEMNKRVNQKLFIGISPTGDIFESDNQREFALEHNLNYKGLNAVLRDDQQSHRGWSFKYKEEK